MALRLLGRGGEHAVWRYIGPEAELAACVLRIGHSGPASTSLPALAATLGSDHAPVPLATLHLPKTVAMQLCESASRDADPPEQASTTAARWMQSVLVDGVSPPLESAAATVACIVECDHMLILPSCPRLKQFPMCSKMYQNRIKWPK